MGAGAFEGLPGRPFAGVAPRPCKPVAGAEVAGWDCETGLVKAAAGPKGAVARLAGCGC